MNPRHAWRAETPAAVRTLWHLCATDGQAAARLLDAGHGLTRFVLGDTRTTSYLTCPRCRLPVSSTYRTERLACPFCREPVCEVVGRL